MEFNIKCFNYVQNWMFQWNFNLKYFNSVFFLNRIQKTPLYIAVKAKNVEIVKLLLSNNKIDVNPVNKIHYELCKWNS